jgi:hypothetical protein
LYTLITQIFRNIQLFGCFLFYFFSLLLPGQVDFSEEDPFLLLPANTIRPYTKYLFLPVDRLDIHSLNLL